MKLKNFLCKIVLIRRGQVLNAKGWKILKRNFYIGIVFISKYESVIIRLYKDKFHIIKERKIILSLNIRFSDYIVRQNRRAPERFVCVIGAIQLNLKVRGRPPSRWKTWRLVAAWNRQLSVTTSARRQLSSGHRKLIQSRFRLFPSDSGSSILRPLSPGEDADATF